MAKFSKNVDIVESNEVKVLVILEALRIFRSCSHGHLVELW